MTTPRRDHTTAADLSGSHDRRVEAKRDAPRSHRGDHDEPRKQRRAMRAKAFDQSAYIDTS
jgi:hypothetical protein